MCVLLLRSDAHVDLRRLSLAIPVLLLACAPGADGGERVGAAREAMTVCPAGTTLEGVDISHYDGDIDWPSVVASGRAFAFAKATEGLTFTDPKFADNWAQMKQAGIARSAYHFFHSNDDPDMQAEFLLQTMGPLEPGDLPPSLDLEVADGESAAVVTSTAITWLDHVAGVIGQKPILYTSKRVVEEDLGNAMGLQDHAVLWDAEWQVSCPDLPDTFTDFAFWQYADDGTVPGIGDASAVDLDVFNGDANVLAALEIPAPSTSTSTGAGGASGSGGASAATTTTTTTTVAGASTATATTGASTGAHMTSTTGATSTGSGEGTTTGAGRDEAGASDESGGCALASGDGGREGLSFAALALALAALGRARRRARA